MEPGSGAFPSVLGILGAAALVLAFALGGWVVWLHLQLRRLTRHYQQLVQDAEGQNLQQILDGLLARLDRFAGEVGALRDEQSAQRQQLDGALQRFAVIRFNPFRDTGGDQSFAIALLNTAGDGVLLTGLFARDGSRVYAKPIQAGQSPYPLTDEEDQAIRQAMGK
ncbi:MAG: DUF4446 family protein [Chloroflexi bacterium]|nr:DUF4446 family protein [Chloroflexota bacterium]